MGTITRREQILPFGGVILFYSTLQSVCLFSFSTKPDFNSNRNVILIT